MNDIIKIVQALENSNILLKGVSKTIENDIKKQDGKGIGMLLGTLGGSLLGNLLTGKGLYRSGKGLYRSGEGIYRAGEGLYRSGKGIKKKALIPPHPLTNFETEEYYENEQRSNCVYSRDNLPDIDFGAYIVNLQDNLGPGTHWIALYVKNIFQKRLKDSLHIKKT